MASPKAVLTYFKWAPQWITYPHEREKRKGEREGNKTFISMYLVAKATSSPLV